MPRNQPLIEAVSCPDGKVRIKQGERVVLTLEEGRYTEGAVNICAMKEGLMIAARINLEESRRAAEE